MRKVILSINVTLDGYIDHTAMKADEELHKYFADQLNNADIILFGRNTYRLMEEFWPNAKQNASLNKGEIEFTDAINSKKKIVFSKTLKNVGWDTKIIKDNIKEEMMELKSQPGKDLLLGGGSNIITTFMNYNLIDEMKLIVQPIILGKGKPLFQNIKSKVNLKLLDSITLNSGRIALHYKVV